MLHKIFTIRDVKANAYLLPFFLPEQGQATRTFQDCVNDPKHAFGRHPADYTLFTIGTFDDEKSKIEYHEPYSIGNGLEYVLEQPQTPKQDEMELTNA